MFLGFGEIMARLCPADRLRWRQVLPGRVEVTWGGGEANVCASLALFGMKARYVTALPRHPIAESLVSTLRGLGVDVDRILYRKTGRLGLYFVEAGANQRGSTVIYDRIRFCFDPGRRSLAARLGHHARDQRNSLPDQPGARAAGPSGRRHHLVRLEFPQEALELAARHRASGARS
jgi:sugar/nucleoside kinase (ribokinase family)